MVPTFGGSAIFGAAVRVVHLPEARAMSLSCWAGSSYTTAQDCGGRGRRFEVLGVLVGPSPEWVAAAELELLSYADGIPRTFVDTQGRLWPNVLFEGDYRPDRSGPKPTDTGWCLPYRCELVGLE